MPYDAPADAAPFFTLVVDADGRVCDCDASAARALGLACEALVGQPLSALIPGAPDASAEAKSFSAQVRVSDSAHLHAEVMLSPLLGGRRTALVREVTVDVGRAHRDFVLSLADTLQGLSEPRAVLDAMLPALGRHLGAQRVLYSEMDFAADTSDAVSCWTDGTVPPLPPGPQPLTRSLGPRIVKGYRRGETLVNDDALDDDRAGEVDPRILAALKVRGVCTVPYIEDGELVGVLSAHTSAPHSWTPAEVQVVEEVAARTREAYLRAQAQARLRDRDRAQAFLLQLAEGLRREASPTAILSQVQRSLGEHLNLSRVGYAEVDALDHFAVQGDWTDGAVASVSGRYPLALLGEAQLVDYRAGRTRASPDVEAAGEKTPMLVAMQIAASITVPLLKAGRLTAMLSVQQDRPRAWTRAEVQLVEDVAERTWEALERARAETRTRESEEQFRTLAENLPNLCWISGPDGRVLWGNRRYEAFFAWRLADAGLIGESVTVHPDDREASIAAWAQAHATGEPVSQMIRCRDAEGGYRPFYCQAEPVRGADGRVARWCGILTDLSEQTAQERRAAFLLELAEAIRRETEPLAILRATSERLGRHLEVDRVVYGEVEASTGDIVSPCDWCAPGLEGMAGRRLKPTADNWVIRGYREGRTVVAADFMELPDTTDNFRSLHRAIGATAFVTAPLVKEGRLHGLFSVYDRRRRDWSPAEVALVEEVGERTWEALWRARAEASSRASEEQFRTFAESLPDIAFVVDGAGAPLWWNGRHEEVLGPGRGMGHVAVMCHPDERDAVMGAWGLAMAAGEPIHAECRLMCADGRYRLFRAHASPVKDPGGKVVRWAGLVRDVEEARVRERVQAFLLELGDGLRQASVADATLALAAERLAAFLDVDLVGFSELQPGGEVLRIEQECARGALASLKGDLRLDAFGPSARMAGLALGRPIVVGEVERELAQDPMLAGCLAIGVKATLSIPIVSEGRFRGVLYANHGSPRDWTPAEADLVREVAERTWAMVERARAETALERSREALYQSEKLTALGSLLAGVSHELNNPLSIVVAQSVMMERQAGVGPLSERARQIRAAADRCARIVQTFLAMARQRKPERRRVDLNAVVDAALELTAYGLRTSGVKVVRAQAATLPPIAADADQLHQVIINLVINAQQAMQEHAHDRELHVSTTVAPAGDEVWVEIADTGPGVPDELRRRIFEPFFTTKPQEVGTGVGLSFSQGLVEAHGGRLELLPDTAGAAFRISLPIAVMEAPAPVPTTVPLDPEAPLRHALVIDDEPEIACALAEFLGLEGFRCDTAFGGAEAKLRLATATYDLIVSDLRMPDIDGPTLYAWIKAERPDLARRVAFATGDTLGATAVRFLAREGRPFMEKPFTPESLRNLLDDMEACA